MTLAALFGGERADGQMLHQSRARTADHHDALVGHQPARAILAEQRHLRALRFSVRNSVNFANM